MKSRWISLLLLVQVLTTGASRAEVFTDVSPDHPAAAAVEAVTERGILNGFDGKFYGDKLVNRYQMAVIARKLLDVFDPGGGNPEGSFVPPKDVSRTHWAFGAVARTDGRDLFLPQENGDFRGDRLFSRYDLAYMLGSFVENAAQDLAGRAPDPGRPVDVPAGSSIVPRVQVVLGARLMELRDGKFHGDKLVDRFTLAASLGELLTSMRAQLPAEEEEAGDAGDAGGADEACEYSRYEAILAERLDRIAELEAEVAELQRRNEELEVRIRDLEAGRER